MKGSCKTRVVLSVALFAFAQVVANCAQAQTSGDSHSYTYDGTSLKPADGLVDRAPASWQIWLYSVAVKESRYGASLPYARWGVIEGASAARVSEKLGSLQRFEREYTRVFGTGAWGHYTFAHPVGPIAVAGNAAPKETAPLLSDLYSLEGRIGSVADSLEPSLHNVSGSDEASQVRQYFDEVRTSLQGVSRFYDQASRLRDQPAFLSQLLKDLKVSVRRAEDAEPKVRAVLPNVKLPARTGWMSHTEQEGREGTLAVTVGEAGDAASVRQVWSGGDGSMTGTDVVTIVPYQNIGAISVWPQTAGLGVGWVVQIEASDLRGFSQRFTSPERVTATRTFAAVDLKTSERFVFLTFSAPDEAQDAYAFFLYHQERRQ